MRNLKNGRFVDTPSGVGVVFESKDDSVVVHLIDKKGETTSEQTFNIGDVSVTDKPLPTRKAAGVTLN